MEKKKLFGPKKDPITKMMEKLQKKKPEIAQGIIILTKTALPVKKPTIKQMHEVLQKIEKIVDETLTYYTKQPKNKINWHNSRKPSADCYENFCVRKGEIDYIEHNLRTRISTKHKRLVETASKENTGKILGQAQALVKSEQSEQSETKTGSNEILITDVLKSLKSIDQEIRCPFLKEYKAYTKIDITNMLVKDKKGKKIPDNILKVSTIPDEPLPLPTASTCLLKQGKPIECILYGLDTELNYLTMDIEKYKKEIIYVPIVAPLHQNNPEMIPTLKWMLAGDAINISSIPQEAPMKKRGII